MCKPANTELRIHADMRGVYNRSKYQELRYKSIECLAISDDTRIVWKAANTELRIYADVRDTYMTQGIRKCIYSSIA